MQTYIRELLWVLADAVDADLVAAVQADAVDQLPNRVRRVVRPTCAGVRRALHGLRSLDDADVVHGLDVDLPLRPGAPTVATVHDLSVFDVPWSSSRRRRVGERLLIRQAVRRADALLAVSAFTAERVKARFGREAVVTHLAPPRGLAPASTVEVESVRARYRLPEQFVLHVGTVEPRKDIDGLAVACRQAGVRLVLAGARTGRDRPASDALHLGYVPNADLASLYTAATVVGYLSRYEGFGLPAVEAMACGAPVVATAVPALREVLGDGAVLVPVNDVDRAASAIRELVADDARRAELAAVGQARVAELSWNATAAATVAVYRDLGLRV